MFAKMTLKLTAQTWQLPGTNIVHKEPQNQQLGNACHKYQFSTISTISYFVISV